MKKIGRTRTGMSTMVSGVIIVILLIIAIAGFALYATKTGAGSTQTQVVTTTVGGSTVTTTVAGATSAALISGGFSQGNLTTFGYTQPFNCTPAMSTLGFSNASEVTAASAKTPCAVGAGNASAVSGSAVFYVLVPAFAGLSVFGVPALGASAQGYPVFNGTVIFTDCGAGGTGAACPTHPTYLYSPDFTAVEKHLNIAGGYGGLPEGVLPVPAHDHIVQYTGSSIPWYGIAVLVFDPNIFPNALTGQCHQVVSSNLTNPTANCLTSIGALSSAAATKSSAAANANSTQDNPIYDTFAGAVPQALVPGVTAISSSSPANTNLFLYFSVNSTNPYA